MRYIIALFLLAAVCVLAFPSRFSAQVSPGIPQPCTTNDSSCNVGVTWYYAQATNTPFPLVATSAAYQYANAGKVTEMDNPNAAGQNRAHFVYMTGAATNVAWNPALCEYNLQTNVFAGCATIDATYDTSTSGQTHDFPSLIPGPNGEILDLWGAITGVSKAGQFGSSNGTATGTTYAAQPYKMILPTASPSAVAAAAIGYMPDAAQSSETWSVCWRTTPGVNAYANETERCFAAGQAQKCKCYQVNGNQFGMGNNQVGFILHWTSTIGGAYVDAAGSPSPSPGPLCSAISYTNCNDLQNSAVAQFTNSQTQITSTPGDNDWSGTQLLTVVDSTSGSYAFHTLPNNGEFNANTQCTVSGTTAAGETVLQLATDISNTFNGSGGTIGTGFSGNAACTSQRVNYVTYVATVSASKSNACSSSSPCIVFALKGCTTYSTNCDIMTPGYQLNAVGAPTCTSFCTASATTSQGINHPTLYTCKLLSSWGQEAVCSFDIDHLTQGFGAASYSGTSLGIDVMLVCFGKNDYSISTHQWTMGTCNLNGTRNTALIYAGDHITSDNPASVVSGGIPSGQGATTSCPNVSPYLMPNPSATPSGFISFVCDLSANQDPNVTGTGFPVYGSADVTNLLNGNLLVLVAQSTGSSIPKLFGCVYDVTTGLDDGCLQVDSGTTLAAAGDFFQISSATGSDGTLYIVVTTASTSAHSCGSGSCAFLYTAPPTMTNTPSFSYVKTVSLGGSASAGAPGTCPLDQEGGHHLLCAILNGTFASNANTTSMAGYDFYLP